MHKNLRWWPKKEAPYCLTCLPTLVTNPTSNISHEICVLIWTILLTIFLFTWRITFVLRIHNIYSSFAQNLHLQEIKSITKSTGFKHANHQIYTSKWLNLHLHHSDKSPNLQEIKAQITKSTSKVGQIYSLQKAHTPSFKMRVIIWGARTIFWIFLILKNIYVF